MQRLIAIIQKEHVHYVFFETLTDPKIARLLAQETGAETAVLDPLEGLDDEGRAAGLDYLSIMERNVHNLEKALQE